MSHEKPFDEIEDHRLLYASSYHTVKALGKFMLGFKVYGLENVPSYGRALIATNHRHWLDIFLGPISVPDRHLTMIAKKEIYRTPMIGGLFRKWGAISVDRENPEIATTREVLRRLRDERLVAVLPEGHRYQNKELGELHGGVALWARLGQASTIPAAIRGVDSFQRAILYRSAEVRYGSPIDPPASRTDEDEFMTHLRQTIQALYDS